MYPNSSEGKLITADQAQKVAPVLTAIDAQIFAAIDEAAKNVTQGANTTVFLTNSIRS